MKKWHKIILWIIGTPITLLGILLLTYIAVNKQGVIEPFQHGSKSAEYKILIVSQGSDFKEALVENFVSELASDSIYLSILDCTELNDNYLSGWDAYIIIHTMQIHKMPKETDTFLKKITDLSKLILVSTSGAGDEHYKGVEVDAISSASRISAIEPILKWTLPKLEKVLRNKKRIIDK
jgi:hypothetical protein